MKTHMLRCSAALLLALLPLVGAHARQLPGQDPVADAEKAREQAMAIHRRLEALPPACTLGTARARQGKWQPAFRSMPEPGSSSSFIQLFDTAPATGAALRLPAERTTT